MSAVTAPLVTSASAISPIATASPRAPGATGAEGNVEGPPARVRSRLKSRVIAAKRSGGTFELRVIVVRCSLKGVLVLFEENPMLQSLECWAHCAGLHNYGHAPAHK